MPIYTFKCTNPTCGHIFDALKPMKHRHEEICPKCGHKATYDAQHTFMGHPPLLMFKSKHEPGRTGWDRIDNGAYYDKSKRKNRRDYEGG